MSTETKPRFYADRHLSWGWCVFDPVHQYYGHDGHMHDTLVATHILSLELATTMAAAPALLEALRNLNAYVQKELIPSVREVVGGQALLDAGWQLVAASHAAIAQAEKGDV